MQEALPWTRRIRSVASGRLNLVTEWYMEYPGRPTEQFYLSDMSDGSVRMLCWACILLSPQIPGLLVIEEPEIGIHVSWMRILASWIKQASRRTQVIVSTHSPDLLDHFTDNLESVMLMKQTDSDLGRFCMTALNRSTLKKQLDEGWQLGDLYRVGDPSIGGWPW
jgi:predicted ATPase